MNSTTLKVPNQLPQTLENNMNDSGVNHSGGGRYSLGDGGFVGNFFIDNSRSLSRDSSFSSYSTTSTTGSSSCGGDLDSPLRRIIARGSSRRLFEQRRCVDQEDRPCSRLFNSRRKYFGVNREGSFDGQYAPNLYKTSSLDAGFPQNDPSSERSRSEPEVLLSNCLLSSPQGLIIATPPTQRASVAERRARSKSDSYDDENDGNGNPQNGSKESKTKKKEKTKRRITTSFDWCLDESVMKRVVAFLEGSKDEETTKREDEDTKKQLEILKKERDVALTEREEALRDFDRLKCERNALELERDNLRQERDYLKNELTNRNKVIDHLKDHLGKAHIPFKMDSCVDSTKTEQTLSLTVPKTIRQRSKSEVRPPQFFVPDEIFQRSNAYTRL